MTFAAQKVSPDGGWEARLRLGFRASAQRTVLAQRARQGPLSVQRPFYPEGDICHVYLLHPPGGVVGGDSLQIEIDAAADTHALVTTPGATKFYRSAAERARQTQRLVVGEGASLEWLPQENIFFPGAEVDLATRVELAGDARFALWEINCLGRPASREVFDSGRIDSRLEIYRDQVPLLLDRLRVAADNRSRLSLMAGLAVGGTLIISHAGDETVDACRDLLLAGGSDYTGATLVDDLLVVRYLGNSTEKARRLFTEIWQTLRPTTLGHKPNAPRIWAT